MDPPRLYLESSLQMDANQLLASLQLFLYPSLTVNREGNTLKITGKTVDEVYNNLLGLPLMRQFGSREEFQEDLYKFLQHPNTNMLKVFTTDPYVTTPVKYTSVSGKHYLLKFDVFIHIQNLILVNIPEMNNKVSKTAMKMFLRCYAEYPSNYEEFTCCNDWRFGRIEHSIMQRFRLRRASQIARKPVDGRFITVYPAFEEFLIKGTKAERNPYKTAMKESMPNKAQMKTLWTIWEDVFTTLTEVFREMCTTFDPSEKIIKIITSSYIIRVFQDGEEMFVIKSEFDKIRGKPSQDTHIIRTVPFSKVQEYIERHKELDVECVIFPIPRCNYRALPVRIAGTNCDLAADCLLDLFRSFTHGSYVFQKVLPGSRGLVRFLNTLQLYFDADVDGIYFLKGVDVGLVHTENPFREAKEIREVGDSGFSLEDLKDELKYLNLHVFFPGICDYANVVYDNLVNQKDGETRTLKTSDMMKAIGDCQLIGLFKKLPKMTKFLCNQKQCHRVQIIDCKCHVPEKEVPIQATVNPIPAIREPVDNETLGKWFDTLPENIDWNLIQCELKKEGLGGYIQQKRDKHGKTKLESLIERMQKLQAFLEIVSPTDEKEEPPKIAPKDLHPKANEEVKRTKKQQRRYNQKGQKPKVTAEKPEVKDQSPESKACPKCFSNSQHSKMKDEKIAELKSVIKALRKEIGQLKDGQTDSASAFCSECAKAQDLCEKVQGKLQGSEEEVEELKKALEIMEETNKKLENQLEKSRKSLTLMEQQVTSVNLTDLEEETANFKILAIAQERERSLKQENLRIQETNSKLRDIAIQKDLEIANLKEQLEEANFFRKLTPEVEDYYKKLKEKRTWIVTQDPIGQAQTLADRLLLTAHYDDIEAKTAMEITYYTNNINDYQASLASRMKEIKKNPRISLVELGGFPEVPKLSTGFCNAYKEIFPGSGNFIDI